MDTVRRSSGESPSPPSSIDAPKPGGELDLKMKLQEDDSGDQLCGFINRRLLPLKIHVALYVGALVGVMPFIVVQAEYIGISSGLAGITNAIMLLVSVFLKFFLGAMADKFQAIKPILFMVVLLQAVFHIAIYTCITPIEKTDDWKSLSEAAAVPYSQNMEYRTVCGCNVTDTPFTCDLKVLNSTFLSRCDTMDRECCSLESRQAQPSALNTWQFWVFFVLRICAGGLAAVSFSISDTATYAILGNRKELYGRQRLWGTLSWGAIAPAVGWVNQYFAAGRKHFYGPGFYYNAIISAIDLVAVCFLDIPPTSRKSQNIGRDLARLFSSKHVLFFTLTVFVQGTLMGPIWSYAFTYFSALGAPQTLLGLQLTVQCFVGETPVLFFAGWFISKLGFKNSISFAVAGTVLRLGVYAFGTNPWMMLPAEALHGLSYGLFYSAMTLYANRIAFKGTEATVQGIYSGMFEGAGIAVGSMVCGLLFDIDQRRTMLYFTIYGFVFLLLQIAVNWLLGDPPIIEEDEPTDPSTVKKEEPSQSDSLLREGTISRTDTDVSDLKDQTPLSDNPPV